MITCKFCNEIIQTTNCNFCITTHDLIECSTYINYYLIKANVNGITYMSFCYPKFNFTTLILDKNDTIVFKTTDLNFFTPANFKKKTQMILTFK